LTYQTLGNEFLKTFNQERVNSNSEPEVLLRFLGIIEGNNSRITTLEQENQLLKDENNRLKGEQGKPEIKEKQKGKRENKDISSEKERKSQEPTIRKGRGPRNEKIKISREEICHYPKDQLPADAQFKGHVPVIVQDVKVELDNIRFLLEIYYSPSTGKTYRASRPPGYEGEFGPGIVSLIYGLKFDAVTSEPGILRFLTHNGVFISLSTISRYLTQKIEDFHKEKEEIINAGLQSTRFQQIDSTGARVNGDQHHAHVLCNPYYTAYFTTPHKDRLTVLKILTRRVELKHLFNSRAFELMKKFTVPKKLSPTFTKPVKTRHSMKKRYSKFSKDYPRLITIEIN
jgi:hypothetical protein